MFYWPPLPYFCLTLAGRTPGRHSNSRRGTACCGPPEGRRPARAPLKGRKSLGNSSPPFTVHDCQVRAARSPGGPKAQRAGPAVLRTAKARSTARPNPPPVYHHILSGSACRPSPRAAKPLGDRAGDLKVATIPAPALPQFCRVRPRRAPHAPLMRRPRRGRRFREESRYSLSVQVVEAGGA